MLSVSTEKKILRDIFGNILGKILRKIFGTRDGLTLHTGQTEGRKDRTGSSFALAFCRSSRRQALYSAVSKTEGWKFPLSRIVNQ